MTTHTKRKIDLWWVHFGIIFFLMFLLHFLIKPSGVLSQEGVNVLCIFAGLIYGWGFFGLLIPSIMSIIALGFTGLYTVSEIAVQGFGNDIVIFVLLLFIFIGLMQELGITQNFAVWLLTRKLLQGRPWLFSAMMCFVAYIICAVTNNFVAMFMVWGMWFSIFKTYDFKPYTPYVNLMMLGTIIGVTLGAFILPFKTLLALIGAFMAMAPDVGPINYLAYMTAVIPLTLLFFVEYFLICKFIFKPDISRLQNIDVSKLVKKQKMDFRHYLVLGVFALIIVALLIPSFLPETNSLKILLNNLGYSGIGFLALLIPLVIRYKGEPVLNLGKIANKYIAWDALFMIVIIMLLSPILSNEQTGIGGFIAQTCAPIFGGHSALVFMIIFCAIVVVLTNFFNNMIIGFLFMNIIVAFYEPLGIDPWTMCSLLFVAMHLAILTPSSSGQVGMVFAMSDWVDGKWLYKATFLTFFAWIVTYLLIGIGWIRLIFGLFS